MKNLYVEVSLYGKKVGVADWSKDDYGRFEFYPEFVQQNLDIAPLTMPLASSRGRVYSFPQNQGNCFCGLPGLLSDALPDKYGTEKIDAFLSSRGIPMHEITALNRLCYIGKRAMGALEFEPSEYIEGLDSSAVLNVEVLVEVAQMLFDKRNSFQELLQQEDKRIIDILKVGTSAGGAKPKAIIAYNEKTGEVRSGQVEAPSVDFGYWILKFDGVGYQEHDEIHDNPKGIGQIEYAYHLMAKASGIEMNECRLLEEGDSYHFMTKRFDRGHGGEKIHVQTLAAIAHLDRDKRNSYEQLFEVMRRLNLPYNEKVEMYRRMVFNVMARNHDDHTKNHAFLMSRDGQWSLSPAYDLCYSYNPNGRFTRGHQMYLNGKNSNFSKTDLLQVADLVEVSKAKEIIEQVQEAVSNWRLFAQEAGVREDFSKYINENLILFESGYK